MSDRSSIEALSSALDAHLSKEEFDAALDAYAELETSEPSEPRWPHRLGDLHLRLGSRDDAIRAYERAVDLYASTGFVQRAAAMAKVILGIDADRMDVLERVDGNAALELRRRREASGAHRRPTTGTRSGDDASRVGEEKRISIAQDAHVLAKASDSREDEVRFAEARSMELELDLSELDDAKVPSSSPAPGSALALARMPSVPLLAGIPKEALTRMLRAAELRELRAGELLVRAGDPSDALFVLAEGEAEVRVPGIPDGTVILGEGEIVGETTLLPGAKRKADVVARGSLRAICLSRASLLALIDAYPAIGDVLYELLTKRLLANLMRTHALFTAFEPETRLELARLFELRRADGGTRLLEAGKRSDGIYVPLLGTITATLPDETTFEVPAGALLGERSLLSRAPSSCTVEATSDALVLRLSTVKFTELAAMFPTVLAHLTDVASQGSFDDFRTLGA